MYLFSKYIRFSTQARLVSITPLLWYCSVGSRCGKYAPFVPTQSNWRLHSLMSQNSWAEKTGTKYQAWFETRLADTKDTSRLFMRGFTEFDNSLKNAQCSYIIKGGGTVDMNYFCVRDFALWQPGYGSYVRSRKSRLNRNSNNRLRVYVFACSHSCLDIWRVFRFPFDLQVLVSEGQFIRVFVWSIIPVDSNNSQGILMKCICQIHKYKYYEIRCVMTQFGAMDGEVEVLSDPTLAGLYSELGSLWQTHASS